MSAWTSPSLRGLSPTTWVLNAVQGVIWLHESLHHVLLGGLVYGVVATTASACVLTAIAVRREAVRALAPAVDLSDLTPPTTQELELGA